jgi:hypothetical protein
VLTTEIEHVDIDAVEEAAKHEGINVQPKPSTIRVIQVWGACNMGAQGDSYALRGGRWKDIQDVHMHSDVRACCGIHTMPLVPCHMAEMLQANNCQSPTKHMLQSTL